MLDELTILDISLQGVRTHMRSAPAKQMEFLPNRLFTLDRNSKNETSEFAGIRKSWFTFCAKQYSDIGPLFNEKE
jgi:hypothetical protein